MEEKNPGKKNLSEIKNSLSGKVSRRAVNLGLLSLASFPVKSAFAAAGAGSKAPTTSKQALEGEAVEAAPDLTLVAKFATYDLDLEYTVDENGKIDPAGKITKSGPFKYMCRTFAKDGVVDENFLGPVIELKPGQKFSVLVKNRMFEKGEYAGIGPAENKPKDWLPILSGKTGPSAFLHKQDPLGFALAGPCGPGTPIDKFYVDWVNMPKNYNWTNLHTHGLQVTPHIFEPEGTLDPKADYITIKPGQDYTYHFELPEDHPPGTYWYHIHRHNAVAIQAWSGMAGLIAILGKYDEELKNYGVTTDIPFAVHDPHYNILAAPKNGKPGLAKVARFLDSQNVLDNYTFMVTGRYRPEYTLKRNQVVRLRHLTATIENLCAFRIVKLNSDGGYAKGGEGVEGENHPFYIVAADGINFERPVKENMMVTAGGQRNDILLSFSEPGEYAVVSDYVDTVQFFGTGPKKQTLAKFRVTNQDAGKHIPIEEMRFTPGMPKEKDIRPEEITRRRHFVFDLEGNTCRIPFPQFKINDLDYRPDVCNLRVKAGDVEEWVISNPSAGTHPFHIHVNPFQVKETFSALTMDENLVPAKDRAIVESRIEAMHRVNPINQWRDTVMIPPKGMLRVWMRFRKGFTGKTVYHCHFLAHEETGMVQNFIIEPS